MKGNETSGFDPVVVCPKCGLTGTRYHHPPTETQPREYWWVLHIFEEEETVVVHFFLNWPSQQVDEG